VLWPKPPGLRLQRRDRPVEQDREGDGDQGRDEEDRPPPGSVDDER
jgi:hypothetical protein